MPELPYQYNALAPHISEKQLTIHHQKHHRAYVNGANALAQALAAARQNNAGYDAKAVAKELSFQLSGHILHSLFWQNGSVAELALKRNFQISREPNEKRGGILGLKYVDD